MKLLILGGVMACQFNSLLPQAICQDNKPAEQRLHLMATAPVGGVSLEADRIERGPAYPSVIQLRGNVEIKTKTVAQRDPLSLMIMVVRADEAEYHEDTGEIEGWGKGSVEWRGGQWKQEDCGCVD